MIASMKTLFEHVFAYMLLRLYVLQNCVSIMSMKIKSYFSNDFNAIVTKVVHILILPMISSPK